MDNITRQRKIADSNARIRDLQNTIKESEEAITREHTTLQTLFHPCWKSDSKNSFMPIPMMQSRHLLAAARLCITRQRYDGRPFTHDAETLESFYYLTREIARRRLHKVFKNYLKTGILPRGIR